VDDQLSIGENVKSGRARGPNQRRQVLKPSLKCAPSTYVIYDTDAEVDDQLSMGENVK